MEEQNPVRVSDVEVKEYVPSKLHPDTLFHFTDKLEWILNILKNKRLSPRYCRENIEYLHIPDLAQLAYPMICFCDINLHKLKDHIAWYGMYGIAFSKEWGMSNGIQPVQYINDGSPLCTDMAFSLNRVLSAEQSHPETVQATLEDLMILQLMYWKPCYGAQRKAGAEESEKKCFSDESEWRYIPDLSGSDMPMIIRDENVWQKGLLSDYSDTLDGQVRTSILFQYTDIKHIILASDDDYKVFEKELASWDIDEEDQRRLRSKVLIWNNVQEDL